MVNILILLSFLKSIQHMILGKNSIPVKKMIIKRVKKPNLNMRFYPLYLSKSFRNFT